ncbi:phytanoyl-CoA dioxygenase family protein [Sphingopyxis sp. KK2]|uniref:phytanoyl-CoA dioxygenase family protein n=1 Tax=Sphingopyxis sp. KK2 TaxID=1855727 RepID=UPI00097E6FEB|nr:phytanoyl-CoA dioxygenase family protein [Sphingopyxis sp. KK2]
MDAALRRSFDDDGAVVVRNCLDSDQLALCRGAFDWAVENHGPNASMMFEGTEQQSHVDNANPNAKERLDELVTQLPFGKIFADLWGSENVWYFAEEIFFKTGGNSARTSFHQDTSYLPWTGKHWGNAWISFEAVPKKNSLEIVKGSHRGIQYDGPNFTDPNDPTSPLHGEAAVPFLPRLPDIDAELARDPAAYDILSWAVEPGDVVLLHPHSLHGGAQTDPDFPTRHTLVLRFFGDDATFRSLPESNSGLGRGGILFTEEMDKLKDGDRFRAPVFKKLV